jgi:hypothetical protein
MASTCLGWRRRALRPGLAGFGASFRAPHAGVKGKEQQTPRIAAVKDQMNHSVGEHLVLPVPAPAATSNAGDGSASPRMPYSMALRCSGLRACRCRRPSIGCSLLFLFRSLASADTIGGDRVAMPRGSVGKTRRAPLSGAHLGAGFHADSGRIELAGCGVLMGRGRGRPAPSRVTRFRRSASGAAAG